MTKRDVVKMVLDHNRPPYVPWSFGFTVEAREKLLAHYGQAADLEKLVGNHFFSVLESDTGTFQDVGNGRVQDMFGVVWDRSIDRDIGTVEGCVLRQPTLKGYRFPDPLSPAFFKDVDSRIARSAERFRVYPVGFSLYERAWTLRGMENLLIDFLENPSFVHELLEAIADFDIARVKAALSYDVDAVHFGDDWGQQRGLQMGYPLWKEFIYPELCRIYGVVKDAGKYVTIHCCGDVDELFDDLVEAGVDCFNPFQPEVMDTTALLSRYRPVLSFHGGLSTQRVLPMASVPEVRRETDRLIAQGGIGGYILAPAHAVEGDVPLKNMLAFIEAVQEQTKG